MNAEAIPCFRQLVGIDPRDAPSWFNMGHAYYALLAIGFDSQRRNSRMSTCKQCGGTGEITCIHSYGSGRPGADPKKPCASCGGKKFKGVRCAMVVASLAEFSTCFALEGKEGS
jgi:hypothetical protein